MATAPMTESLFTTNGPHRTNGSRWTAVSLPLQRLLQVVGNGGE